MTVMQLSDFVSLMQTTFNLFYAAFNVLNYPLFTFGDANQYKFTLLEFFVGVFILDRIVDAILDYIHGE